MATEPVVIRRNRKGFKIMTKFIHKGEEVVNLTRITMKLSHWNGGELKTGMLGKVAEVYLGKHPWARVKWNGKVQTGITPEGEGKFWEIK